MINENILSIFMMVSFTIFALIVLRFTSKITKTTNDHEKNNPNDVTFHKKFLNKKENVYKLVEGHEPFKWRIGLALALASLDKNSEKKFLSSLSRVLKEENYIVENKRQPRAIRRIMPPIHHKKIFNGTTHYSDMYTVKRLMDGSTDKETIRYILELNIEEFLNKRNKVRRYTVEQFNPFERDDDPFNQEEPF